MFEESVSIWASMNSWFTPTVLFVLLNLMIGAIAITSSLATHKPSEHQKPQDPQQPQHPPARSPSVLQRLKSINFYSHASPEPPSIFAQNPSSDTHFTSHYTHQHQHEHEQEQQQPPQLARSPSVLQRLKSINLYNYLTQEPTTTLNRTQEDAHYTPEKVHEQEAAEEEVSGQKEEEEEHIQEQEQTLDEIYDQLKGTSSHVSRTKSDTKPASADIPRMLSQKMKKSASSKSAFSHFEERDVEARRPATVREGKARATEMDDDEVDAKADDFINKFKQQLKLQRIDSILRYKETISRRNAK